MQQKNLYQFQQSTLKYHFSFRILSDRNMKMDCHAIFFMQRLNLVPRGYVILDRSTHGFRKLSGDSPENRQELSSPRKLDKNFITRKIRRKSRHFTL